MAYKSVVWNYINKKSIAIEAIRDYRNMQKIIDMTSDDIKEQYTKMMSLGGGIPSGMPLPDKNTNLTEEKIINSLYSIDVLNEKYNHAVEFLKWFNPPWNALNSQEKYILDKFYSRGKNTGAAYKLSQELKYSEKQIYRIKDDALNKFTMLFVG
jgi:hypothetical protein